MAKVSKKLGGAPFPTPVVLATTTAAGKNNIITLAWAGVVCSAPLMIGLAIRPSRQTHAFLLESHEVVVNLPREDQVEPTDTCGMVSGRDADKFALTGWTAVPGKTVAAPLIKECPISLECRVAQRLPLGSHDLFICEVLESHVEEDLLDEKGRIDFGRLAPFVYAGMDYWSLASKLGHYGYSKKEA
jgi:flavin reductase (DIM6/NTAB) family NADH-FMN oxidoreductase RutF